MWALRRNQSEYFSVAIPSLLISWWLPTYSLWHVPTLVHMDANVLWWKLLTAPLWHRVVFSWHGSWSQNPWALKADASTVPSRLNVFSRGKGRKCVYAFLMNGAWLTVFSPYAAVVGPRLQTPLKCVWHKSFQRISGNFSSNILCVLQ